MNPFPIRVLMVSNDPSIFTADSESRARLREYALHVTELHVLSRGAGSVVKDGTLTLHGAGHSRILTKLTLARRARKIAATFHIDVISAQDPFEHGRVAAKVAEATGAGLHLQIHTDFLSPHFAAESFINRVRVRIADAVLPKAQGIRVVSDRIATSLVARYGNRVVTPAVLPIAVSQGESLAAPLPEELPQFRLVAVSRLTKEKRLADVLAAVARARARYASIGLAIVGEGPERSVLAGKAKRLGIASVVSFLGARKDARALMKSATAFIQASSYEGYGRTFVEAALAHVPILTTDVGIVGDVFHPEDEALVCPVGDVECLARQIERLVGDNALRQTLSMRAHSAAAAHVTSMGDMPYRIAEHIAGSIAPPQS